LQNPTVVVAFVGGLLGPAVLVLLNWWANQRKSRADAGRQVSEAHAADATADSGVAAVVLEWSKQLRDDLATVKGEVETLRIQIDRLERQNRALRRHNEILTAQVIDLGGVPLAMPED
jgi:transposase-like protein